LKLIVGLGNPGAKYQKTRHNAGFLVLDAIADRSRISWQGRKFDAEWARGSLLGEDCLFLKPQTFMNLSGRSVAPALRFYKLQVSDVVVLHDDIDVPFGKVKTRMGGGHGGHNGIKSLLAELGSEQFSRVKLGVGRPQAERGPVVSDWVLMDFLTNELEVVETSMVDETLLRLQGIIQQTKA
jgi:PTH1 family peptidyl-tRNA hydrolase